MIANAASTAAFTVRRCTSADAALVADVGARLFIQAYGPTHPEPELSRYLARAFNPEFFTRELRDPAVRVLVVEAADGTSAGYAHMRATVGEGAQGVMGHHPVEIVRFYIDGEWHGRGLAQMLMAACVAEAQAMGGDVLWLQVWQEAPRAQAFYRRSGLTIVGTTTFQFGERRDEDYVMAMPLPPIVTS